MGLINRSRGRPRKLAQKGQQAAREGRTKYDQAQAKRSADMMFRGLGAAVFAERTGRGVGFQAGMSALVTAMGEPSLVTTCAVSLV